MEPERKEYLTTCMVGNKREEGMKEGFIDLRAVKDEKVRESWDLPRQRSEKIKDVGLFKRCFLECLNLVLQG